MAFEEGDDLFFTWDKADSGGFGYGLAVFENEMERWERFSLDRIKVSSEAPWDRLSSAILRSVDIYSAAGADGEHLTTTTAHHLQGSVGSVILWISTGSGGLASEGDDLLVSLDCDLAASGKLRLIESIQP